MDKGDATALANGDAVSDAEIHNGIATKVKTPTEESMRCRVLKTIGLYLAFAGIVRVFSHKKLLNLLSHNLI